MRVRRATADEVRPLVQRAQRFATTDETLDELLTGTLCLVAEQDGVAVAGWAQQTDECGVLRVLVYGGRSAVDLTAALDRWIGKLDVNAAMFRTRRRGLMRKAEALGYRVIRRDAGGVVMRKDYR